MKQIYWVYISLFVHLSCVAPSFALDGCLEHEIMTDPSSLTAMVNLDPYNRYEGELGTDLTHEVDPSIYHKCMGREQIFYNVSEGNYIYRNSNGRCRVSVVMNLEIEVVDDAVTLDLPCDSSPFSPYFYRIIDNDYLTSFNAIHPAKLVDSLVTIYLVEAPSFVSVTKGGLWVDMPEDGAEGIYEVKYYLRNNIGLTSNTATASIRFRKYCPEDPVEPMPEPLFDLPSFFTPNGDGVNDVWEIAALDTIGRYKLNLFDRYGRLIRSYQDNYIPWDGTTEGGNKLPSADYWFYLFFYDLDRSFVGHVTLVR